jgi:uncharacterized protein involved in exopolysaccharide biosynthesis
MKKFIGIIIPVLCVVLLITSCKPKLKQVNGRVTYFRQDTIKVMVDGDEKTYLTDQAQFLGGMPMVKDTVEIMRLRDKAQIVRLIPPKGHIVNIKAKSNKPLLTSPAPKDNAEREKKFLEIMNSQKK